MKAKILAVAIAGMLAAPLAMAADAGWYAGAGIGQTSTSGAGLTKTSDTAFRLLGGYKYNQNLAAEIEYVNLGSIQYQSLSLFDVKSSGFGIAAVGTCRCKTILPCMAGWASPVSRAMFPRLL